jgi:hypothetical protein
MLVLLRPWFASPRPFGFVAGSGPPSSFIKRWKWAIAAAFLATLNGLMAALSIVHTNVYAITIQKAGATDFSVDYLISASILPEKSMRIEPRYPAEHRIKCQPRPIAGDIALGEVSGNTLDGYWKVERFQRPQRLMLATCPVVSGQQTTIALVSSNDGIQVLDSDALLAWETLFVSVGVILWIVSLGWLLFRR